MQFSVFRMFALLLISPSLAGISLSLAVCHSNILIRRLNLCTKYKDLSVSVHAVVSCCICRHGQSAGEAVVRGILK